MGGPLSEKKGKLYEEASSIQQRQETEAKFSVSAGGIEVNEKRYKRKEKLCGVVCRLIGGLRFEWHAGMFVIFCVVTANVICFFRFSGKFLPDCRQHRTITVA